MDWSNLPKLTREKLGKKVPRRNGKIAPPLASLFLKTAGWQIVGDIPDIPKAVLLAVPHTSNMDGVFAIPTFLALDADIKILGKKELFKVPVFSHFLKWAGVISIDRADKGSILQASIDRFKQEDRLFLGIAPEGTRGYTDQWKTGFYHLAVGAEVPILPVAMDYKTKEVRFLPLFYPTGDIEADLPKIYNYYKEVEGRNFEKMSKPLQDLHKGKGK